MPRSSLPQFIYPSLTPNGLTNIQTLHHYHSLLLNIIHLVETYWTLNCDSNTTHCILLCIRRGMMDELPIWYKIYSWHTYWYFYVINLKNSHIYKNQLGNIFKLITCYDNKIETFKNIDMIVVSFRNI